MWLFPCIFTKGPILSLIWSGTTSGVSGDVDCGNYFNHLLSWLPHKDDKNVLFLKYEDMKRDLRGAVSQIAAFLEVKLTSDTIEKIAEATRFEQMKDDGTANYSWVKPFNREGVPKFMRKGVVGDWKDFLSTEQSSEMDTICAKTHGLEFRYE